MLTFARKRPMVPVPQQISETKNINNTEYIHRKIAKKNYDYKNPVVGNL